MLAVAVVALTLVIVRLSQLSAVFHARAAWHGAMERRFKDREHWSRQLARKGDTPRAVAYSLGRTRYHAAMKQKYADAARRPWLPVPPDPPEPE
jgi:hypothetical protein